LEHFIGHQTLEHFISHQAWNILLATKLGTFHWPPSLERSIGHQTLDLPSPPFSFYLKGGLVPTSLLRRKKMINLSRWEKEGKENENLIIVLKEWK
jgi:hypothetical protein